MQIEAVQPWGLQSSSNSTSSCRSTSELHRPIAVQNRGRAGNAEGVQTNRNKEQRSALSHEASREASSNRPLFTSSRKAFATTNRGLRKGHLPWWRKLTGCTIVGGEGCASPVFPM